MSYNKPPPRPIGVPAAVPRKVYLSQFFDETGDEWYGDLGTGKAYWTLAEAPPGAVVKPLTDAQKAQKAAIKENLRKAAEAKAAKAAELAKQGEEDLRMKKVAEQLARQREQEEMKARVEYELSGRTQKQKAEEAKEKKRLADLALEQEQVRASKQSSVTDKYRTEIIPQASALRTMSFAQIRSKFSTESDAKKFIRKLHPGNAVGDSELEGILNNLFKELNAKLGAVYGKETLVGQGKKRRKLRGAGYDQLFSIRYIAGLASTTNASMRQTIITKGYENIFNIAGILPPNNAQPLKRPAQVAIINAIHMLGQIELIAGQLTQQQVNTLPPITHISQEAIADFAENFVNIANNQEAGEDNNGNGKKRGGACKAPYHDYSKGKASVFALTCIDPRYTYDAAYFLQHKKELHQDYDLFTLAGASVGASKKEWTKSFFENLELGIKLHGIKEVWCFDHLDCGMYKATFGLKDDLDPKIHIDCMDKLRKLIKKKHPELKFRSFLIDAQGHVSSV